MRETWEQVLTRNQLRRVAEASRIEPGSTVRAPDGYIWTVSWVDIHEQWAHIYRPERKGFFGLLIGMTLELTQVPLELLEKVG
jgi:hypothetical protein